MEKDKAKMPAVDAAQADVFENIIDSAEAVQDAATENNSVLIQDEEEVGAEEAHANTEAQEETAPAQAKEAHRPDCDDVLISITDLHKSFGKNEVLRGVTTQVKKGEKVVIIGPSGSGKSTLLHMMGGLDTPTSGNVIVRDKELSKMNDEQLTIFRRRNIGFIFQNYNLVPILNVYENIVLPVELDGDTVDQKFLDEIVYLLGLEDKLKNMPNNLSGGQQQRVAIARALITKPAIVLADEPTGNLDSKTSTEVLGLIKRTSAEFRQTVVMITHNDDIARLADRIVRIEDGKIVE